MPVTIGPRIVAEQLPGYDYGTGDAAKSPVSLAELEQLKQAANFTKEDERYLHMAGEVVADQTQAIVETWRSAIARRSNLAQHSKDLDGKPIPRYSTDSGLRFQQWILDTCFRPYDQDWLNYQHEIALRHTSAKKNVTDNVQSTSSVPLQDIIAFTTVINSTIKPFLASKKHPPEEVERMHAAWSKSVQLQVALWSRAYTEAGAGREDRSNPDIERIFHAWDSALSNNDVPRILALYADTAELQSPLVSHLMNRKDGICRGKAELRAFFDILATRKPAIRKFHRTPYFTDGKTVMWEYPHLTPEGEQMDFVEVMEIADGLIQKHRVYWGWFGFNVLKNEAYQR